MPLPPIITTISTPSRIPTPILTPSRIPILNPLDESKKSTPFNIKKPSTHALDNIKKQSTDPYDNIKPSSKVSRDDNNGDIDEDSLYDYVPYDRGAPGTATAEIAMENDVKNSYHIINYLQKKLLNAKNYDEYNKITDNIDQLKKIKMGYKI